MYIPPSPLSGVRPIQPDPIAPRHAGSTGHAAAAVNAGSTMSAGGRADRDGRPNVSAAMVSTNANIGVALSGGGIRAAIFHLGVLRRLAELGLLENLRHISTVSGASLAVALLYAKNEGRFPDSQTYLHRTLPAIRSTILKNDIQDRALMSLTVRPWNWRRKANLVAEAIEQLWDVRGDIRDLPPDPLWSINCTTFETGKDFRITQKKMGDYKVGYTLSPSISIAEASAASAGFPVLIGPYRLSAKSCGWADSGRKVLHLWDGGVYDNLGLEALYKISGGGHLTGDLNYLIVSNASASSGYVERDFFSPVKNLRRLLNITMDQVDALRSRDVTDYLERTGNGCYLKICSVPARSAGDGMGKRAEAVTGTAAEAAAAAKGAAGDRTGTVASGIQRPPGKAVHLSGASLQNSAAETGPPDALSPEEVSYVKHYPTTLSSPAPEDFDLILRHGYEVAREKIFTPSKVSFR